MLAKSKSPFSRWTVKRLNFEIEFQKRWIKVNHKTIAIARREILALQREVKARRDSKRVRTWKKKMNGLLKKTLQKKERKVINGH